MGGVKVRREVRDSDRSNRDGYAEATIAETVVNAGETTR